MLTVILPAAGEGSRLNLPYPKEIHRVLPGVSLVDFSLDHIKTATDLVTNVVTVIAPGKEVVADYVEQSLGAGPQVDRAYFDSSYSDWPGSIRSAQTSFGGFNVVLLPDSVLETHGSQRLMESYAAAFATEADLVFAYVDESDPDRLASLGALRVEGSDVVGFSDKPPADDTAAYNAFWASFAFRDDVGAEVLDLMMASVAGSTVDLETLGLRVAAFSVESYTDLGTWSSLSDFQSRHRSVAA